MTVTLAGPYTPRKVGARFYIERQRNGTWYRADPHGFSSHAAAAQVAERLQSQEQTIFGLAPIDQEQLDLGIVIAPGGEIGLGDRVGGERAVDLVAADRETEAGLDLGALETGAGGERGAVEHERLVVVGEALDFAVAPRNAPAAAKRRGPAREMRGKAG